MDQQGNKKYFTITYGCQMNESDSEKINGQLEELGYLPAEQMEEADIVILNTCSIRQNAEEKVYGKIGEVKQLKDKNPHVLLGIAGCMAQENRRKLVQRMPIIDFVIGPYNIHNLHEIVTDKEAVGSHVVLTQMKPQRVRDYSLLKASRKSKIFAWVPIMQGCNKFCTYCIVPYVRGRETSRTIEDIKAEVISLAQDGYKEITLLGQNVNSYGLDFKNNTDFSDLIRALDTVEGIKRIRYMTSHPRDMTKEMVDVMAASSKVVRHMHLPVQHGSNEMLKRMNRGYTVEHFYEMVDYIRERMPDVGFTTDLITGFPGETEEMHQATIALLKKVRFDSAYTFIYSPRRGTPAASMTNQISDEIKHRRLNEIMEVQNQISLEINKELEGQDIEILVEGPTKQDENHWFGRTSTNKMIVFPKVEGIKIGDIVLAHVNIAQTWILKGIVKD
ncbi:tRNA (N6-isopentenyl adenosine(37)-C2)-methylthiotransferase MiaB [Dialister pneumosintes]|uniref:tRNA-2-methylthio-N(6)-dimethylallyladenosine synthase n=1 Tax=Dialister pneumosintes TaxID=39950 RepID=A0A1B3WE76_9FIRM|nr:tRNA (N6-isopentenyl adenosine(37)-C2)-methylthiotransferase MiaB [Dialister pneumosintes]AOH39225.1 tRNA (N6-isopentenyl adenosine(37)-C2)-methylthiotransferase MiaB [Dialister pneumosintes]MBS6480668.1 tRNA (N6-isopentenyl adenosine(37)-C2)-methylthiotransferase MiaB [Dialister sp.]CDF27029.1 (Dimethylallyl)adenosine tRNA methylthiotransferase MiaB [Dialister sp. CAG:588]